MLNAGMVADIQLERHCPTAKPADLRFELDESRAFPTGKNKIGPSTGKGARKCLPESAAGAGHDCDAATQIEETSISRRLIHDGFPGVSTTFIRFGSRE